MTLKPIQIEDINLFKKWLDKDRINKWFCPNKEDEKEDWLKLAISINGKHNHVRQFIVYYDSIKIGYCLYLDAYFEQQFFQDNYDITVDEEKSMYEIGYLIGEEDYLHKGLGKIIVKELVEKIREIGGKVVLADPDEDNIPSIKVLLDNGFTKIKDGNYRKILQ